MRPRATSTTAYDDLARTDGDDDDGGHVPRAPNDDDDGAGTLSVVRRDQGESYRDLRRRGPEARDRGQDREVPTDTGSIDRWLATYGLY